VLVSATAFFCLTGRAERVAMRMCVVGDGTRCVVVDWMAVTFRMIAGVDRGPGRRANPGADDGAIAPADFSADCATYRTAERATDGCIDSQILGHDRDGRE
jgi:hypothetical protein